MTKCSNPNCKCDHFSYGERLKAAGGLKGALARFVGATTPDSIPILGKIGKNPYKYSYDPPPCECNPRCKR